MRSILAAFLMAGTFLVLLSSCATVSTEPLGPDELRLLDIHVPGSGRFKVGAMYTVTVRYESGGQPKVQRACFILGSSEPRCARATDTDLGLAGSFQMDIGGNDVGPQRLQIYVDYLREGRLRRSNVVTTLVEVTI